MEPKKNPSKDLNRKSGLYFAIGLMLVLLMAFAALEWKTYDNAGGYDVSMNVQDELVEDVPITMHIKTLPPPKRVQAPPVIEVAEDDEDVIEDVIKSEETNQEDEILKIEDIEVDGEEDPDLEIPFIAIEDVPVFPGCENAKNKRACFQEMINKHIVKNFRYPEPAQEMDIQGRVNIMFVIQKDGSIGNVQLHGPHKILEAEARRIIDKLPKMEPGKQRGQPVRVPFSLPIHFKLQ
ncbi:MAG: TonB family protein [Pricia sp.]